MKNQNQFVQAIKCYLTNGKFTLFLLIVFTQFNSYSQSIIESDSFPKKISELILSTKKKNVGVSYFVNENDQATLFGKYICKKLVAGLSNLNNNNTLYKVKELVVNNDYCNSLKKDSSINLIIEGIITEIGDKFDITITLIDKSDCTTIGSYTISDVDKNTYSNKHSQTIPCTCVGASNQNYNQNNLPPPQIPKPNYITPYGYGPNAPGSGYGYPNTSTPQYQNQPKQKPIKVF
ncbi:MAG: hypothetical protein U0U67_13825 [Chitinophagales bacterium]